MSKKPLISVYILPPGSKPIVRVECPERVIEAERLFKLCCDTIGLYEDSRKFFGLFRGMLHPIKKYGTGERIALPVKTYPISIQKWSFDLSMEVKYIKTDPIALKLLASQYKSDAELSRKHPSQSEQEKLKELQDPEFLSYKQYLEYARTIEDYDWITIQGVEIVNKVKLINNILHKGSKVDVTCTPKKMIIVASSFDVAIPWRKVRRFAEIKETRTTSFEILMDGKAFTWLELKTIQGIYLLQCVTEFIDLMNKKYVAPEFRQPKWVTEVEKSSNKGLTLKIIKDELFGSSKKKKKPKEGEMFYEGFDAIDVPSSDEDFDDGDGESCIGDTDSRQTSSFAGSLLFGDAPQRSLSFLSQSSKKYVGMEADLPCSSRSTDNSSPSSRSRTSSKSSSSSLTRNEFELLSINDDF